MLINDVHILLICDIGVAHTAGLLAHLAVPLCTTDTFSFCFSELPQSEYLSVAEATWLALNVVSGGGSATNSQPIGVTKIAKSVIAPLADHNISVFMLSTYQTDFILVSLFWKFSFVVIMF